jgi:predicted NUDIX family NTP pyrophosphohydrolase
MKNHVVEFKRNFDVLKSNDRHMKKEHYKRNVVSCGIITYKLINHEYYYLCVHPGGPYFKYKDKYAWSNPKGVVETNESFKETACREFEEETGIQITNNLKSKLIYVGYIRQKGGKIVHGWMLEDPIENRELMCVSNYFQMEFPKHSGNIIEFPEVDKTCYFKSNTARYKLNVAQAEFINRWEDKIHKYILK